MWPSTVDQDKLLAEIQKTPGRLGAVLGGYPGIASALANVLPELELASNSQLVAAISTLPGAGALIYQNEGGSYASETLRSMFEKWFTNDVWSKNSTEMEIAQQLERVEDFRYRWKIADLGWKAYQGAYGEGCRDARKLLAQIRERPDILGDFLGGNPTVTFILASAYPELERASDSQLAAGCATFSDENPASMAEAWETPDLYLPLRKRFEAWFTGLSDNQKVNDKQIAEQLKLCPGVGYVSPVIVFAWEAYVAAYKRGYQDVSAQ